MEVTCSLCTRQFSKRGHLIRHQRSHDNQRPHQCSSCGKTFNRRDILTRHRRLNCSTVARSSLKQPESRTRLACDNCVKLKLRCSESDPCGRCQRKNVPCVRRLGEWLIDPTDADNATPENPPRTQLDLVCEGECQQKTPDSTTPEFSGYMPQVLGITGYDRLRPEEEVALLTMVGKGGAEASLREAHAAHDTCGPMLDWPSQNYTPPQGLNMDFLDLFNFSVNELQGDTSCISEPHSLAAGQVDGNSLDCDSPRHVENQKGHVFPGHSDCWNTCSWSGMIQVNLWSTHRPPGLMEPEDVSNRAEDISDGPQALPRSMLNLLSLEDILAMEDYGHVAKVRREQVEQLWASYMANDHQPTPACLPSHRGLLSNPQVINSFVQLYFEHFHHTFPILHRATFNVSKESLLLILAVATIGGRFSKIPQAHRLSTVLGDMLRKAVEKVLEEDIHETIQIPFAQAAVLNQIQTAYHGSRHLALKAQFQRAMLVTVCRGIKSRIRRGDMLCDFSDATSSCVPAASKWLDKELSRRLTFGIWLVDCQFSLNSSIPPIMSLEDLEPYLPCHETLWDLTIARLSERLKASQDAMQAVTLKEALNTSKLAGILASQNLGLFARSITMTAVFYQWHTATSVNRYMLQGAGEHTEQDGLEVPLGDETQANGCPAITSGPLVSAVRRSQWRHAAFEAISSICENTITWPESASSQLRKLYHHISILLIVPLQPMCEFIGWMGTTGCIAEARENLCVWLRADTQNVRRAVMHAIALFSLIRKRKSGAHSENHHLFIGFLMIWTFFSLDPIARPTHVAEEVGWTAPMCNIDWNGHVDLSAQEKWISAPGHPPLRIAGVGNLREPSGLHQMLVETHRMFLSDRIWGINRLFAGVLEGLISQGTAIGAA